MNGTHSDALAMRVQATVGTQFSPATIRLIIDAADQARADMRDDKEETHA